MKFAFLKAGVALRLLLATLFLAVTGYTQSFPVIKTIDVDIHPFGAATSPDGNQVWVANSGTVQVNSNKVTIIDVPTLTEQSKKITVGHFPEDIAFTSDGATAFVTNSSDATVSVIDTATETVRQTVSLPKGITFPFGIVFNKKQNKAFVSDLAGVNQAVVVLNTANTQDVTTDGTVGVLGQAGRLDLRQVGNEIVVGTNDPTTGDPEIVVIDGDTKQIVHELLLPGHANNLPQGLAVTPDSRFAYVGLFDFIDHQGGVWVVDLLHLTTVTIVNTGDPEISGVRATPDGRFIFATNFSLGQTVAISTSTNTVVSTTNVGRNPNDIAFTLDSSEAFVTNQGDTTVSVISIPQ
jgi:YVTN family beta-propeller protein